MSACTVQFWVEKFKSGCVNVHSDVRIKRKREVMDDNIVTAILTVLEDGRRYTIDNIQEQLKEKHGLNVSHALICRIVKEAGLKKVYARLVPSLLADTYEQQHLRTTNDYLTRYAVGPSILERIVTRDEIWVHYITFSHKKDSMV